MAGAVGDAEQSVTCADPSGDASERMINRATHADALHQAGRRAEAETRFREAEQMQVERQPAYPLLYSLPGFRYCDLLLAAPQRAAWQLTLRSAAFTPLQPPNDKAAPAELGRGSGINAALQSCRAVSQRAAQTLKWEEGMRGAPLLDFALHHLTLGRAAFYEAILESCRSRREDAKTPSPESQRLLTSSPTIETTHHELDAAVTGLRRADTTHHIPRALLTRVWLRSLTGPRTGPESAQSDLDEAWEIAERGPMKLFLADIHLYRARLFGRQASEVRSQESGVRSQKSDVSVGISRR